MRTLIFGLIALLLATSASAQSNYKIRSGDVLAIEVLEDPSLNRQVLVLPDGSFSFPFAGSISAGGRTVDQVKGTITAGIASNFATQPNVFVSVQQLRPREAPTGPVAQAMIDVYFIGEVNTPGLREVSAGTNFLQALSQNGGFTRFAATKRVQLRRTDAATGEQRVFVINYKAIAEGAAMTSGMTLQDGDVIIVPERRLFE